VVFRVEDTGVGLVPGQESRVWERFYQAESSSTRRFGGAGLGLSIVRRLTELHRGRVEATSRGMNLGSTFAVYLPTAHGAAVKLPVVPVAASELLPRRAATDGEGAAPNSVPMVLVVEDDQHIANVLRTYLESDGYHVEVAGDGQAALQLARTLQPFAITLDISLPKVDGWTVLNALKHDSATASIPVVVVSIVDNREFGMVLGATEYLVKPIDPDRLRGVLRSLDSSPPGGGSVLIVDDDPALREVLSSLLEQDGWQVDTASDGVAALAMMKRERPSAVVLDLMMPGLDGFEVLHALRAQPTTRDLPVIVVTAKDLTDDDRERLSRSAQRIILKQAMPLGELRDEIRSLLVRRGVGEGVQDGGSSAS
jgi:DNA-binding response OmpR family regulator